MVVVKAVATGGCQRQQKYGIMARSRLPALFSIPSQ